MKWVNTRKSLKAVTVTILSHPDTPDPFQSHFTTMTLLGSQSSCEVVGADVISSTLQVKKVRFRQGYWRSGLEPLELSSILPLFVFISRTNWFSDPDLFRGRGYVHREEVFFQARHGKHFVAKACFALRKKKRPRSAEDTSTRLP